jgi:hypothetical protein
MVGFGGFPSYEPRWPGVVELNLGDQWRARWVDEQELPPNAPVAYAYALVFMGDRAYLTRPIGEEPWRTVEGPVPPGEAPEAALGRLAAEQTGAVAARLLLVGFLECRATSHNPEYEAGAVTVRPVYALVAQEMTDLGPGSPYQRRRLLTNEHIEAIRQRYPELWKYLGKASERYLVLRARGEV